MVKFRPFELLGVTAQSGRKPGSRGSGVAEGQRSRSAKGLRRSDALVSRGGRPGECPGAKQHRSSVRERLGRGQDDVEAGRWYGKAADQGNASSQNNVGRLFEKGRDYAKAMRWYREAADQGNAVAQINIGSHVPEWLGRGPGLC